jgi:hypothetical protein
LPAVGQDARFSRAFPDRENTRAFGLGAAFIRLPSPLNGEKARMRGGQTQRIHFKMAPQQLFPSTSSIPSTSSTPPPKADQATTINFLNDPQINQHKN